MERLFSFIDLPDVLTKSKKETHHVKNEKNQSSNNKCKEDLDING